MRKAFEQFWKDHPELHNCECKDAAWRTWQEAHTLRLDAKTMTSNVELARHVVSGWPQWMRDFARTALELEKNAPKSE